MDELTVRVDEQWTGVLDPKMAWWTDRGVDEKRCDIEIERLLWVAENF